MPWGGLVMLAREAPAAQPSRDPRSRTAVRGCPPTVAGVGLDDTAALPAAEAAAPPHTRVAGEDAGDWMRAFSEILLSPPGVEILRVDGRAAAPGTG